MSVLAQRLTRQLQVFMQIRSSTTQRGGLVGPSGSLDESRFTHDVHLKSLLSRMLLPVSVFSPPPLAQDSASVYL